MSITTIAQDPAGNVWLDLANPAFDELREVAKRYSLHPSSVEDCLDPTHLPKGERFENAWFFILRVFDENSHSHADTVQELTRKVAIFIGSTFVITIHRTELGFLKTTADHYQSILKNSPDKPINVQQVFFDIVLSGLNTYNPPLEKGLELLSLMENQVFLQQSGDAELIRNAYFFKSRIFIVKRMVRMVSDSWSKLTFSQHDSGPWIQEIRDTTDDLLFYCEDLIETTHQLMNLHISLQSQRTNEVMRILTVFSVIFLPLNLIAGIYGMNFEFMPELKNPHGYPIVLGVMLTVATTATAWVVRRGWHRNR